MKLAGLPLALDQAGAYIEETACGLADYLKLLRERAQGAAGAARRAGFRSSFRGGDVLNLIGKAGQTKSRRGGAIAGGGVSCHRMRFRRRSSPRRGTVWSGVEAAASDPIKWNDAIAAAFKFSLLERDPGRSCWRCIAWCRRCEVAHDRGGARTVGRAGGAGGGCGVSVKLSSRLGTSARGLCPARNSALPSWTSIGLSFAEAARLLNAGGDIT